MLKKRQLSTIKKCLMCLSVLCAIYGLTHLTTQPDIDASELTPIAANLQPTPDFASIVTVADKKSQFIDWMRQQASLVNLQIQKKRDVVIKLRQQYQKYASISQSEREWVEGLAKEYSVQPLDLEHPEFWSELDKRVDIVPPSLVIAQSANESGWGTSRFARQGNNFFGVWCYTPGCGVVPKLRPAGAKYEVRRYSKPIESVNSYVKLLNTSKVYEGLRTLRQACRQNIDCNLVGTKLVNGLGAYSERGQAYVQDIAALIKSNGLQTLDKQLPYLMTDHR